MNIELIFLNPAASRLNLLQMKQRPRVQSNASSLCWICSRATRIGWDTRQTMKSMALQCLSSAVEVWSRHGRKTSGWAHFSRSLRNRCSEFESSATMEFLRMVHYFWLLLPLKYDSWVSSVFTHLLCCKWLVHPSWKQVIFPNTRQNIGRVCSRYGFKRQIFQLFIRTDSHWPQCFAVRWKKQQWNSL